MTVHDPSVFPNPRVTDRYPLWHPMTEMGVHREREITIVRGEGVRVWDRDGREYISATGGLWNVSCGFNRPEIVTAIVDQVHRLPYGTLFRFGNEPALELAQRLVEVLPGDLTRVFLTTSGAGAVDTALKIVRRYFRLLGRPDKRDVVCLSRSYHGTSIGSMAVTGEDLEQGEYGVDRRDVRVVGTPDPVGCSLCGQGDPCVGQCAEELFAVIERDAGRIAAVIVEPVLGSAGVVPVPIPVLTTLQTLCTAHDVLLVIDEIATGFGRTGRMFASEHAGLEPDLVTMSKAINSGYLPLGATAVSEEVYDVFARSRTVFSHGETQAGNPVACAAGVATLDVLAKDDLVLRAAEMGGHLSRGLHELRRQHWQIGAVTGRGLMIGVRLVADERDGRPLGFRDVQRVVARMAGEGLLVHPAPTGFSLFPPLVIGRDDVDVVLSVIDRVLGADGATSSRG